MSDGLLQSMFESAFAHHQNNEFVVARQSYERILEKFPEHADTLHLLGVIEHQMGEHDNAISHIDAAIKLSPEVSSYYNNLGNVYLAKKNINNAYRMFRTAMQLEPNNVPAINNTAYCHQLNQSWDKAIELYEQALGINPDYHQAVNNLGNVYAEQGKFDLAAKYYQKIIDAKLPFLDAYINLAKIYFKYKKFDLAKIILEQASNIFSENTTVKLLMADLHKHQKDFKQALEIYNELRAKFPDDYHILNVTGNLMVQLRQFETAKIIFKHAISIKPEDGAAYNNLATIYKEEQDIESLIDTCTIALELSPDSPEILSNLATGYHLKQDYKHALQFYEASLKINPNNYSTRMNYGNALRELFQYEEAEKHFKYILEAKELADPLHPNHHTFCNAICVYTYICRMLCDWVNYEKYKDLMLKISEAQVDQNAKSFLPPFISLIVVEDLELQSKLSKQYYQHIDLKPLSSQIRLKKPGQPLHIGYISPDVGNTPVALLMSNLFTYADKDKFKTYLYSTINYEDQYRDTLEQSVDFFRAVHKKSVKDIAQLIQRDDIDILIDLSGPARHSKPEIHAYRPARVHCHYLNYPGTYGLDNVDYYIGDVFTLPRGTEKHFTEELAYLTSGPIACKHFEIPQTMPTRAEYDLPEDAFVFCCLSSPYRIEPKVFSAWVDILKATPESVLWLNGKGTSAEHNIKAHAQKMGLDADRIIFAPKEQLTHKWRHRLADLCLDTFCLSGGTSGVLAAWAGVPVITMAGETPQSRTGAAMARAANNPELIVNSVEAYKDLAISYAKDPYKLTQLKYKMMAAREDAPLFQQAPFMKELETLYTNMWEEFLRSQSSD